MQSVVDFEAVHDCFVVAQSATDLLPSLTAVTASLSTLSDTADTATTSLADWTTHFDTMQSALTTADGTITPFRTLMAALLTETSSFVDAVAISQAQITGQTQTADATMGAQLTTIFTGLHSSSRPTGTPNSTMLEACAAGVDGIITGGMNGDVTAANALVADLSSIYVIAQTMVDFGATSSSFSTLVAASSDVVTMTASVIAALNAALAFISPNADIINAAMTAEPYSTYNDLHAESALANASAQRLNTGMQV